VAGRPETTLRHLHLHDNFGEGHRAATRTWRWDGIVDPALAIVKAREAGASIVLEHGASAPSSPA